jgi:hypothetical protein
MEQRKPLFSRFALLTPLFNQAALRAPLRKVPARCTMTYRVNARSTPNTLRYRTDDKIPFGGRFQCHSSVLPI